jgi:Na+-transporting methylmalonyl-CoA/oxaloacetate decarboxylase gamma subunit
MALGGSMDDVRFGLTLTIVGMGGTFVTLGIIIMLTNMLKNLFRIEPPTGGNK